MSGSGLSLYHRLAKHYDAIYDWKDYEGESERLEAVARRFGPPGRTTWLDVACGTGRHLEYLGQRHPIVGVDASSEMLRIARRRLPGTRLVLGDMRTFRLGRRFDVVSCLFSAIGHLRTEGDVRKAFANIARHLNPGGVAIVEPWLEPSAFRPGHVSLRTHQSPEVTVARCSSSARRGNRSVVHYHYLIGERGRGIQHFEETDVGLMLTRARLVQLMRSAGLESRFLARGRMPDRGLLIGVKREAGPVA